MLHIDWGWAIRGECIGEYSSPMQSLGPYSITLSLYSLYTTPVLGLTANGRSFLLGRSTPGSALSTLSALTISGAPRPSCTYHHASERRP